MSAPDAYSSPRILDALTNPWKPTAGAQPVLSAMMIPACRSAVDASCSPCILHPRAESRAQSVHALSAHVTFSRDFTRVVSLASTARLGGFLTRRSSPF